MTWFVQTALSNAAVVALLAILVWGITSLVRRPALSHALWVLVLVKLLTPPLIHVPLPWEVTIPVERPAVDFDTTIALRDPVVTVAALTDAAAAPLGDCSEPFRSESGIDDEPRAEGSEFGTDDESLTKKLPCPNEAGAFALSTHDRYRIQSEKFSIHDRYRIQSLFVLNS